MHKQLLETLRYIALRNQEADLDGLWNGSESRNKGPWSAARDYRRLDACQTEWIGFKASCCGSRAVAVPIGCNHRLCPLCNAARLEHYRGPAREMFAAMQYPTFLTLTIPNTPQLTRKTFDTIRRWWKEFYRSNKSFLQGGLYSIETTFNRQQGDWHPHLHIVFNAPWPTTGMKRGAFLTLKRSLEFSWLRITSPDARRAYRRNEYQRWLKDSAQQTPGSVWNKRFRRVTDIRPVKGENAVYEVIKYVSKTNRFIDVPEAVETFLKAVRGVRVVQSFGTFYNFNAKLKKAEDTKKGAASFLECDCGANEFTRLPGAFCLRDVEMDANGRWLLRLSRERQRCRGSSTDGGETDGFY